MIYLIIYKIIYYGASNMATYVSTLTLNFKHIIIQIKLSYKAIFIVKYVIIINTAPEFLVFSRSFLQC